MIGFIRPSSPETDTRRDAREFWYFNNGITILADKINKKMVGGIDRKVGQFSCEGVSVGNGTQTVGSIARSSESLLSGIGKAKVLVKIIDLEHCPEGFASEVTRAANTQNRIERRDFVALDPEQERLRTELRLEDGRIYAIKTGETDPTGDTGCSVVEATVALACADKDPDLAVQANREIGRLWELEGSKYSRIFDPGLSGLRLWRSVEIMRVVDDALRTRQKALDGKPRLVSVHANRLILHLVFQLLSVGRLDHQDLDFEGIKQDAAVLAPALSVASTEAIENEYPTSYVGSLVKNTHKCRKLVELVLKNTSLRSP